MSNFVQMCPKKVGQFIDNLSEIIGQNWTFLDTCRKNNCFLQKEKEKIIFSRERKISSKERIILSWGKNSKKKKLFCFITQWQIILDLKTSNGWSDKRSDVSVSKFFRNGI